MRERINYITGGNIRQPASGEFIYLYLEGKRVKCALQDTINEKQDTPALVHYQSGQIIADNKTLWNEVIQSYNFKRANGISDKDYEAAAESVWNKILSKHGADRIRSVFNSAPIVNQ